MFFLFCFVSSLYSICLLCFYYNKIIWKILTFFVYYTFLNIKLFFSFILRTNHSLSPPFLPFPPVPGHPSSPLPIHSSSLSIQGGAGLPEIKQSMAQLVESRLSSLPQLHINQPSMGNRYTKASSSARYWF